MRIQFQTEDILNRKEVEGSAAENLKCLYLYTGYFEQPEIFTKNVVYFFVIFWYQSCLAQTSQSDILYFSP